MCCGVAAMTLAEYEKEKKRKADDWFQEQLEAGLGASNPNLIPVRGSGAARGKGRR